MWAGVAGIDPVVLEYKWLVAMLLCPKCSGNIFAAGNGASALVIKFPLAVPFKVGETSSP